MIAFEHFAELMIVGLARDRCPRGNDVATLEQELAKGARIVSTRF
jgi:hypothetical protein